MKLSRESIMQKGTYKCIYQRKIQFAWSLTDDHHINWFVYYQHLPQTKQTEYVTQIGNFESFLAAGETGDDDGKNDDLNENGLCQLTVNSSNELLYWKSM